MSTSGASPNHANPGPLRFDLANVALATAVVLLVILAFRFIGAVENVVVILAISIILANAIDPIVNALGGLGFQRRYGVLLIYLILVTLVSVFLVFVARVLLAELVALMAALPGGLVRLGEFASSLPGGALRALAVAAVASIRGSIGQSAVPTVVNSQTLSGLVFATLTVFEAVFASVTIMVIAYFWLSERDVARVWLANLFPASHRETLVQVWKRVEERLGAWSRGQLLLMITVAAIQGVGYTVLGLPYAPLLAAWAGFCELIPMIGPYFGAAPAVLIALSMGPRQTLLVLGFAIVVNLIEANFLIPRIMGQAVGLSPLTVIVALLAGAAFAGIIGAVLAVPVAAAIQVGIEEIAYVRSREP